MKARATWREGCGLLARWSPGDEPGVNVVKLFSSLTIDRKKGNTFQPSLMFAGK